MNPEKFETIIVKNNEPDPAINHNWLESTLKPLVEGVIISLPDSDEVMKITNIPHAQMEIVIDKIRDSGLEILEN